MKAKRGISIVSGPFSDQQNNPTFRTEIANFENDEDKFRMKVNQMAEANQLSHALHGDVNPPDRKLYADILRQLAGEMTKELDKAKTSIRSISEVLKQSRTVAALRKRMSENSIPVALLLGWHNRHPKPAIAITALNKERIAAHDAETEKRHLSEMLSGKSKWLSNYTRWRVSQVGIDQIPQVANAVIFAIQAGWLNRPLALIHAMKLASVPQEVPAESIRRFWELSILPAVEAEFCDKFAIAADDEFKLASDRITATEIFANLILAEVVPIKDSVICAPFCEDPAKLMINAAALEATWNGKPLQINRHTDFQLISLLWSQFGALVTYDHLLSAIRPERTHGNGTTFPAIVVAPPQVKECVQRIREAFRTANAPFEIENIRGKGFKLRSANA